jgi:hypothetical protein
MSIRVTTIIGLLSWPFDLVANCPLGCIQWGKELKLKGGGGGY